MAEEMKERIAVLESENSRLKEENKQLAGDLEASKARAEGLESTVEALQNTIAVLKEDIAGLRQANAGLASKVTETPEDLAVARLIESGVIPHRSAVLSIHNFGEQGTGKKKKQTRLVVNFKPEHGGGRKEVFV